VFLFVPGDRPERFAKAAARAEAIIIDLEDAVAQDAKAKARDGLCALPEGAAVYVRINAAGTAWHAADLAAVTGLAIAGVMLPKAESAATVEGVAAATGHRVVALIENAAGMAAARGIAASAGTARLAFGSIDYCADMGAAHTREALLTARCELVLASRLAGLPAPVDGVTTAIDDEAQVEADARYAGSLGMHGKLCIHPRQVEAARRGFAPSVEEIAWARRILAAEGDGAVSVDNMMVDAPVRARARRILGV
jgi:citrate lyase subunit beta/citryl-CoA lyase